MDKAYVKVYQQKKTVAYADYRVHKCYISPFDLYLSDKRPVIIWKKKQEKGPNQDPSNIRNFQKIGMP